MPDLADRIDALDTSLFSFLEAQTTDWDRRALLAVHAALAERLGSFAYLEIGSYLGGSLQAVICDPRCRTVISIDRRTSMAPDDRGAPWAYGENTTEHMLELLGELPGADLGKLTTFDASTDELSAADLPARPDFCFVDGEHTHDAVLRDARFCAEAMGGQGLLAFHDYVIVGSAISAFVREHWRDISYALAFNGPSDPGLGSGVFVLELGERRVLDHPLVDQAVGSRWHSAVWSVANRPRRTALPFLVSWAAMPAIDALVAQWRHGFHEYVKSR